METTPKIGIEQLSAIILLPPQKEVVLMLSKERVYTQQFSEVFPLMKALH